MKVKSVRVVIKEDDKIFDSNEVDFTDIDHLKHSNFVKNKYKNFETDMVSEDGYYEITITPEGRLVEYRVMQVSKDLRERMGLLS